MEEGAFVRGTAADKKAAIGPQETLRQMAGSINARLALEFTST